MFKPPMNNSVILYVPASDGTTDRYGVPIKEPLPFKANVQESATTTDAADGKDIEPKATILLPSNAPISMHMEIEYDSISGERVRGSVKSIKSAKNLAGNRVFYWTVEVA